MSSLIIKDHPISLLPKLACAIGVSEAIVLQQLYYELHSDNGRVPGRVHGADGVPWIGRTYEEWVKSQLRMWSPEGIRKIFASLKSKGLIVMTPRRKGPWDRVNLITIDQEALDRLEYDEMEKARRQKRARKHDDDDCDQSGESSASSVPDFRTVRTTSTVEAENEDGSEAENEDGSLIQDSQDSLQGSFQESARESENKPDQPNGSLSATPSPKTRQKKTKSSICPQSFTLDTGLRQWCAATAPGVNVDRELQKFMAHEFRTPRSNWNLAFKNWMLRAVEYQGKATSPTGAAPLRASRAPMSSADAQRMIDAGDLNGFELA